MVDRLHWGNPEIVRATEIASRIANGRCEFDVLEEFAFENRVIVFKGEKGGEVAREVREEFIKEGMIGEGNKIKISGGARLYF